MSNQPGITGDAPASWRERARDGIHLLGLWSFAVAQPVFSLLSGEPDFFAVRGSSTIELVLFAIGLTFIAPLPLLGLEILAGLFGRRTRQAAHLLLIAVLLAAIFLPVLKRTDLLPGSVGLALAVGGLGALLYVRLGWVRQYASLLALGTIVFPALFLATPAFKGGFAADADIPVADVSATDPVVFVIFDALPTVSLLDESGRIDAERFPGFGELAAVSTWFPNATTVHYSTVRSVPAIVTGRYPKSTRRASARHHPESLFTLLGGSYDMHVSEWTTSLCPPSLCEGSRLGVKARAAWLASDAVIVYLHILLPSDWSDTLPSISAGWGDFARQRRPRLERPGRRGGAYRSKSREEQFRRFIDEIRSSERPTLHYLHVGLPHFPVHLLPSGRAYPARDQGSPGFEDRGWVDDQRVVDHAHQRFLLQLGFVDHHLTRLLMRLRKTGLYDKSLLVVAADHGMDFRAGTTRRRADRTNARDMLSVPVFIKAPGQREGVVDERVFETVDILPTITEVLGIEPPWAVDGLSALGPPVARQINAWGPNRLTLDLAELSQTRETLDRRLALFGSGSWSLLYRHGPFGHLVGQEISALKVGPSRSLQLQVSIPVPEFTLPAEASVVPALIEGIALGAGNRAFDLAVAINGRVAGIASLPESPAQRRRRYWRVMVDERLFRPGENSVSFYRVTGGDEPVLHGPAPAKELEASD